jgi:hypothetical protein
VVGDRHKQLSHENADIGNLRNIGFGILEAEAPCDVI